MCIIRLPNISPVITNTIMCVVSIHGFLATTIMILVNEPYRRFILDSLRKFFGVCVDFKNNSRQRVTEVCNITLTLACSSTNAYFPFREEHKALRRRQSQPQFNFSRLLDFPSLKPSSVKDVPFDSYFFNAFSYHFVCSFLLCPLIFLFCFFKVSCRYFLVTHCCSLIGTNK